MSGPIECKVAQILSDTELAINAGKLNGVEIGMRFEVTGSVEVKDPDNTKVVLEVIRFVKANVEVISVGDRVSIVQAFGTLTDSYDEIPSLLRNTLRLDPSVYNPSGKISGGWEEGIKIGDSVIQVESEDLS